MAEITVVTFAKVKQIIGEKQIIFKADTIEDLLNKLFKKYNQILIKELTDEQGKLKKHYRILVNSRNINLLDGLSTPFEKTLNKNQKRMYNEIKEICNKGYVIKMTYPELFDVLDRIKLAYQVDMLRRQDKIELK